MYILSLLRICPSFKSLLNLVVVHVVVAAKVPKLRKCLSFKRLSDVIKVPSCPCSKSALTQKLP